MWFSGGTQGEIFPYPQGVSGDSCSLETLERVLGSVVYGTPVNTVRCGPQGKGSENVHDVRGLSSHLGDSGCGCGEIMVPALSRRFTPMGGWY